MEELTNDIEESLVSKPLIFCGFLPRCMKASKGLFSFLQLTWEFSVNEELAALMPVTWTTTGAGLYEGWNFNSGNYLFTTDTK